MKKLLTEIGIQTGEIILDYRPVTGGDISNAYLLKTQTSRYFLKTNSAVDALKMFSAEKAGLEAIAQTHSIAVPAVLGLGNFEGTAYLLLEYIESKAPTIAEMELLGMQLAQLHNSPIEEPGFGFKADNFIGKLPQSNTFHSDWPTFYAKERLGKQIERAFSRGLLSQKDTPAKESILQKSEYYLSGCRASLLHGDLWGGNYLISTEGKPYLIDPAVYYGHSEVDIAMSKLFGGFSDSFYHAYAQVIPFDEGTDIRIALYQLYYLLVHLNMFGSSYYPAVARIFKKYF